MLSASRLTWRLDRSQQRKKCQRAPGSADGGSADFSDESSDTDHEGWADFRAFADPQDEELPPKIQDEELPPAGPSPKKRRILEPALNRQDRLVFWGPGFYSSIVGKGVVTGYGATCKVHDKCKKSRRFKGRLEDEMIRRFKMWLLVANLTEDHEEHGAYDPDHLPLLTHAQCEKLIGDKEHLKHVISLQHWADRPEGSSASSSTARIGSE